MRIRKRALAAATICAAAACFGEFAPAAQSAGPGTGSGLQPFPLICTDQSGTTWQMNFVVAAALKAAIRGTGAANAPFPGALLGATYVSGPTDSPVPPSGEYAVLAPQNGQKIGLRGNQLVCPGSPTLVVAPTAQH